MSLPNSLLSHTLAGLTKVEHSEKHDTKNPEKESETRKGKSKMAKKKDTKTDNKVTVSHKFEGGASCSKTEDSKDDSVSIRDELTVIKEQLRNMLPVVSDLKQAYEECQSDSDSELEKTDSSEEEGEIVDKSSLKNFKKVCGITKPEGPKLNEDLAKGMDDMMSKGVTDEIKEELMKKYKTPSNCKRLEVVQCNSEIFKKASKNTRITESKLQEIQECLNKGICALTCSVNEGLNLSLEKDKLEDTMEKFREITTQNTDTLALLSNSSHMIDAFRKQNFRKEFRNEYSSICKEEEVRDQLFGKDLTEKVKQITDVNKLSRKMSRQFTRKRKNPFLERNTYPKKSSYQKPEFKKFAYKKKDKKYVPKKKK